MFAAQPGLWARSSRRPSRGGDPDALDYLSAINLANLPSVGVHGVKGKWALEDLSKLDSDLYTNAASMKRVLTNIHSSVEEFAKTGGRQVETPKPSGAAIAGEGNNPAAPAATAPPPINLVPAGHDVSFKNHGGVWRNVNGAITKVRDN